MANLTSDDINSIVSAVTGSLNGATMDVTIAGIVQTAGTGTLPASATLSPAYGFGPLGRWKYADANATIELYVESDTVHLSFTWADASVTEYRLAISGVTTFNDVARSQDLSGSNASWAKAFGTRTVSWGALSYAMLWQRRVSADVQTIKGDGDAPNNLKSILNGDGGLITANIDSAATSLGTLSAGTVHVTRGIQIDEAVLVGLGVDVLGTTNFVGGLNAGGRSVENFIDSFSGFSGGNAVTIAFVDADANPVPYVAFSVVGVGYAVAGSGGTKQVNLDAGTYTVRAASGGGVLFGEATIDVSEDGQTFTVTGSGGAIPVPTSPGKTTAYLYLHDRHDEVAADLLATVRLVDPRLTADGWYRRNRDATSGADGLTSWELLKDADYEIRFGKGAWVPFRTGTGTTYHISPQVLGEFGS